MYELYNMSHDFTILGMCCNASRIWTLDGGTVCGGYAAYSVSNDVSYMGYLGIFEGFMYGFLVEKMYCMVWIGFLIQWVNVLWV